MNRTVVWSVASMAVAASVVGCRREQGLQPVTASGYVEATEVRVASKVPGRIATVAAVEGARVSAGDVLATIETTDIDLALTRAKADRDAASAQLRLLEAGARPEDVTQAEAQVAAAESDQRAAQADLDNARADEARFAQLLERKAGSEKQHDDAVSRRETAEAHVKSAADRAAAAAAVVARLKAGARPQEIDGARAHVAVAEAQIATLDQQRTDAVVHTPTGGTVTSRLVEPGELVAVGTPVAVVVDLDRAWASAYVEEPVVPTLRLDQAVTVVTDAGNRLSGRISFISPRAEFTPRNVQTADERAKLVYRVKVDVDNRAGVLKPGMPVTVELTSAAR